MTYLQSLRLSQALKISVFKADIWFDIAKAKMSPSTENPDVPILFGAQFLVKLANGDVCHDQITKAEGWRGFEKLIPYLLEHEDSGFTKSIGPGAS